MSSTASNRRSTALNGLSQKPRQGELFSLQEQITRSSLISPHKNIRFCRRECGDRFCEDVANMAHRGYGGASGPGSAGAPFCTG
jgi:hypothetical protein